MQNGNKKKKLYKHKFHKRLPFLAAEINKGRWFPYWLRVNEECLQLSHKYDDYKSLSRFRTYVKREFFKRLRAAAYFLAVASAEQ